MSNFNKGPTMTKFPRELEELKNLGNSGDPETDHVRADGLLCDILEQIGEDEIVKAFQAGKKWYA